METNKIIERLEKEIVALQDEQTAILKKKYKLEDSLREQKKIIADLKLRETNAVDGEKGWQKVSALLLAIWVLFMSLFGNDDRK
jgi:hypothetical protein